MKKIIVILVGCLALLLLRANFINEQKNMVTTTTTSTTLKEEKPIAITLPRDKLVQGDTLVVKVDNFKAGQKITGEFDQKKFDFIPTEDNEKLIGVIGIDVRKTPGDYPLKIFLNNEEIFNKKITVMKGDFYTTKFVLTPELEKQGYTQSNIVQNIQTNDGVLIYQVVNKYTPESYFNKSFIYPLDSIIKVGDFGVTRKEGNITLRHLGVDLDAPQGTPIYAINDGVVKFAQDLITYGKTIIIDHGFGIYSLYLHLSEFKVAVGDKVLRGEVIGLTGSTGYSLAPHLHLSIKINGASIDPLKFIEFVNQGF
ncbi:MAG: M23 family metallopeptidase [Parcubacteria group bacterium]|nr:M23 family metallopeptidase [Parcubacteria group bacterium]